MLLDRFKQFHSFSVQTLFMAMLKVKEDMAFELYYTQHLCIYLEVPPNISIQNLYEDFCSFTVTSKIARERWATCDKRNGVQVPNPKSYLFCSIHFNVQVCRVHSIRFHNTSTNITLGFIQFSIHFTPTVCLHLIPYCTISSASHCCSYRNLLHPTLSAFFWMFPKT